jgi:hypothetical protein
MTESVSNNEMHFRLSALLLTGKFEIYHQGFIFVIA